MVALTTLAQGAVGDGLTSEKTWPQLPSSVSLGTGQVTEAHGTGWLLTALSRHRTTCCLC